MSGTALTIHIDGAARGNPGPAAFAYVMTGEGMEPIEEAGCLGHLTNNMAEYTALVRALERAAQTGARRLAIRSDSELLVKQMRGEYRVKNKDLQTLYEQAKELCQNFDLVSFTHVPRAQNARADQLCNLALDGKPGAAGGRAAAGAGRKAPNPQRAAAVREEAVLCLRAAATSWARGNATHPPPEQVWDQLWSILEEHGMLRTS